VKTCFKCHVEKPLSEFYRHRMMSDGHLSKCKDCARADVMANRLAKLDRVREYDRQRANLPHRIALRKSVSASWADEFPERRQAHHIANNALRTGALTRPDRCEGCNQGAHIEKHHPDYSKPLIVVWLCKPCHAIADKIRRRLEAS
jgi:hypothetical protein